MAKLILGGTVASISYTGVDDSPATPSSIAAKALFSDVIESSFAAGSGTKVIPIVDGLKKIEVGVDFVGQLDPSAVITQQIIDDTTLNVYSSLGVAEPGNSFVAKLKYR